MFGKSSEAELSEDYSTRNSAKTTKLGQYAKESLKMTI